MKDVIDACDVCEIPSPTFTYCLIGTHILMNSDSVLYLIKPCLQMADFTFICDSYVVSFWETQNPTDLPSALPCRPPSCNCRAPFMPFTFLCEVTEININIKNKLMSTFHQNVYIVGSRS